ncbi:DUF2628 domain-containing protein [Lactobacillus sp. ESL0680]|uniref:DUF2628 domain-containing protein n=1 Tax=Lactobacillus sp. ESL0680 TaxID=2983210 RepID=UPI0023F79BB7|nr:DUF2628 domain-containing protein [Lactobacillus sp. ESL0680]WEV38789.1 DUF2628 domain-containing protein [Lactobacillus sp. ESL0680]
MKVRLKNKNNNIKEVKLGFSWTEFFFGWWPMLIRGDFKWAIISFVINVVLFIFLGAFSAAAWYPYTLIMAFFYNKLYIKDLIAKGYAPIDTGDEELLKSKDVDF